MISKSEYSERLTRLQKRMTDLEVFVVTSRESIYYLTGAGFEPLERPFFLLVPNSGPPTLLTPMLDRDHLGKAHNVEPENIRSYWDYPASEGRGWRDILLELLDSRTIIGVEPSLRMEIRTELPENVRVLSLIEELRMIKTPAEIDMIRRAARYADTAVGHLVSAAYFGSSIAEGVARNRHVTAAMIRENSDFEPADSSVLMATWAAPRSSQPHSVPSLTDRTLEGPHVALAVTRCNGYTAECERTFFTSPPKGWSLAAFKAMMAARKLGISLVRPGVSCSELDKSITDFLRAEGYFGEEVRLHRIGHGFGLGNHEMPWISEGSEDVLQENMIIAIEPGIYDKHEGGVRHSDTILVTRDGPEMLTRFPDKLDDLLVKGPRLGARIRGALVRRALKISSQSAVS